MRTDGRLLYLVILTLLFYPVTIGAEEDIPFTPPESEKVDWQVGVSIFESEISDPGLTSAAALIPRLIRDELAGVKQHKLTNPEKDYLPEVFTIEHLKEFKPSFDFFAGLDLFF